LNASSIPLSHKRVAEVFEAVAERLLVELRGSIDLLLEVPWVPSGFTPNRDSGNGSARA
jgi:hypothetical protein